MAGGFPSPEKNELLKRLARDSRFARKHQEHPKPPVTPPTKYRRIAHRTCTWDLPRSLPAYDVVHGKSIGGQATKWVLQGRDGKEDFYIAKFGNKNGRVEVFTELFNNQLGKALGFEMAHSGVVRLDDVPYFITRNFIAPSEALVHGSLMIEDIFGANKELDRISAQSEQAFYSINFIEDVIREYCGDSYEKVFQSLLDMLIFDALIGSMDRHAKNWGVLRSQFLQAQEANTGYRLAPIFDSARALLWDMPEAKLLLLDNDQEEFARYVASSRPCIGPERDHPNVNKCNHFEFVESLLRLYPHQTRIAYRKIPVDVVGIARKLLNQFPFRRVFSSLRRRVMLNVLTARADRLRRVVDGGAYDTTGEIAEITLQQPAAYGSSAF